MSSIAAKLQQVRQRITRACDGAGRPAQNVTLLAVSKTFGATPVRSVPPPASVTSARTTQEALAKMDAFGRSACRAALALHRAAAEQQDPCRGRRLRLGAQRGPAEDRATPGREQRPGTCRCCSCACRSTSAAKPARAASGRTRVHAVAQAVAALPAQRIAAARADGHSGAGGGCRRAAPHPGAA